MSTMTFTITGEVNVAFTVTELDDGTLKFDLQVLDDTGSIGDLNAIFFDLADDSLTNTLSVSGDDITGSAFKVDGVTKVDSYTNMNGEVINELGKFDAGVQFGTSGIGTDDIRETSFVLSSSSGSLSLADIALQDFGARLTSVGEEDGSRDGSLKLGGESGDVPSDPPPPESPNVANDDTIVVYLSDEDFFDLVNGNQFSVLENDTTDGGPYLGNVAGLTDEDFVTTLTGTNGGTLDLYVDGSVDFHAGSDFDYLAADQTAETEFTYAIDGGDTAVIHVTVIPDDILA